MDIEKKPNTEHQVLPCKLAHGGRLKLPGENKHTELCWVHTQIVAELLHALLQDGILMLVLVAAEQFVDATHRQAVLVQPLVFAQLAHHCRDDWRLHRDLQCLCAVGQLTGDFATRTAGFFLVAPTTSFLVVTLGAAIFVSALAAQRGRRVLALGDTLAHVFLPDPSSLSTCLQSPSEPPTRLFALLRRLNIPSGLKTQTGLKKIGANQVIYQKTKISIRQFAKENQ